MLKATMYIGIEYTKDGVKIPLAESYGELDRLEQRLTLVYGHFVRHQAAGTPWGSHGEVVRGRIVVYSVWCNRGDRAVFRNIAQDLKRNLRQETVPVTFTSESLELL